MAPCSRRPVVNRCVPCELLHNPVDKLESQSWALRRSVYDRASIETRPIPGTQPSPLPGDMPQVFVPSRLRKRILTLSCTREARILEKSSRSVTFGELNEAERAKPPLGVIHRTRARRAPSLAASFSRNPCEISAHLSHLVRETNGSPRFRFHESYHPLAPLAAAVPDPNWQTVADFPGFHAATGPAFTMLASRA